MNIKTLRRPRKLKGFTLLEMVVVIAIIGVLASIIVPSTINQIRSSKIESANVRAEEIYHAVQNYLTDMQIKKTPLLNESSTATTTPAFPGVVTSGNVRKCGITFYVDKSGTWSIEYVVGLSRDTSLDSKCTYKSGISNYLGSTTVESLYDTSFFIYFDNDTYTVEMVLYNEQDDNSSTVPVESLTYINKMVNVFIGTGAAYTQVYGAPTTKDGKSQEYDTNQFLSGTTLNTAPYVGQYPVPYKK